MAAYRIATEAANNTARHSHAGSCAITIHRGDELAIVIEDDGTGIEADASHGVGLASMRHRAEELGGTLSIESAPTTGTRIVARLPLS